MGTWQWIRELFSPPTEAWWFVPVSLGAAGLILVFYLIGAIPRVFAAALTPGERVVARAAAGVRAAAGAVPPASALAVIVAVLTLAFGPRRPVTAVASSGEAAADAAAKLPPEFRTLPRVNADPLIDAALTRAAGEGAAGWVAPMPSVLERLHDIVFEVLTAYARGEAMPARPRPALPRWLEDTVALSIVQGLLRIENCPACAVVVGPTPPNRGWNRAAGQKLAPKRTQLVVVAADAPQRPTVRFLFDGRSSNNNGTVEFWALLAPAAGGPSPARVTFRVVDPASGRSKAIHRDVTNPPSANPLKITETVTGFAPSARLVATAEADTIRTPLAASGTTGPARAALVAPDAATAAGLRATWDAVLAPKSTTRANLIAQGLAVPALIDPGPADVPTVAVLGGGLGVVVLAPGLPAAQVQPLLTKTAAGASPPPTDYGSAQSLADVSHSYALHIHEAGAPPTADSFASADVAAEANVPVTAGGVTARARGLPLDAPLKDGRYGSGPDAPRPVVEAGAVGGKRFVTIRIDPVSGGLLPGNADQRRPAPSRVRAFVAAVVRAAHEVTGGAPPAAPSAVDPAVSPDPGPLLTAADLDALTDAGRRGYDALALALLGTALGLLGTYLWFFAPGGKLR